EIKDKLDLDQNRTPVDATKYHSMIGALMYLTSSRPDIVHATCLCARYQAKPTEKHLKEVKRIFRYLRGTVNTSLCQSRRDLSRNTPLDRVEVLGFSHEVSVSTEGVEELKRIVRIKGEKKEALHTTLGKNQRKYALQFLERAHMVHGNPSQSCRGLQYLTFTCPDLYYAVQRVCLYMHDSREPHFAALNHILRYFRGIMEFGLQLYASTTTSLIGYTDADWAGCPSTRRSTLAKRQHTISRSSAEAVYHGVANVVAETAWLRYLLYELHSPLSAATLVYCDNVSAVYMSANPVQN
nr:ribonuclease H-like domain-containing protein [Tanacetum cinerariifolium]